MPRPAALPTGADTAVFRKVAWRLLPLLFVSYCVAFLDRVNVGFTQLQMGKAIGLGPAEYGFAAGVFFVSYALCEIPANALFVRMGARKTFLRIMFLWGLTVAATAFVTSARQFYVLRLLLGVFEAGFFPGMILYLTFWFPSGMRARVTAAVALANAVASTIAGPLTTGIMTGLDGAAGWQGWQWAFVLEGLPACVLGLLCYRFLVDAPAQARWLDPDEKKVVADALQRDSMDDASAPNGWRALLGDPFVYLLVFLYFTIALVNFLFVFWLPTVIRESGVGSVMNVGWLTAIPMLSGCVGLIAINWSSDHFRERRGHLAVGYAMSAAGLLVSTFLATHSTVGLVVAFSVANFANTAMFALFWTLPPTYLARRLAPTGIALISMLGITAGFVSPYVFGLIKTQTGSFTVGIHIVAGMLLAGAALILWVLPAKAVRVMAP